MRPESHVIWAFLIEIRKRISKKYIKKAERLSQSTNSRSPFLFGLGLCGNYRITQSRNFVTKGVAESFWLLFSEKSD
jgi:hypothetical protein